MTLSPSILKHTEYFKSVHINFVKNTKEQFSMSMEKWEEDVLVFDVRPIRRMQQRCPICMKKCPKNGFYHTDSSQWRAKDVMGCRCLLSYRPQMITCPEHGTRNEYIPWADGNTRFTPDFNDQVAWLAGRMTKQDIALSLGINWRTVGNSIAAAWHRAEPDVSQRLRKLRRISVDETSYQVGHKYMTVVYDLDKYQVVWIHDHHGAAVFSEFCELLTEEERTQMEVVAGDGARWIDTCVEKYFPNATRCVDPFHVIQWVNDVLDDVRRTAAVKARAAYRMLRNAYEEQQKQRNCRAEMNGQITLEELAKAEELSKAIKGAKYALAHSPENRTATQEDTIRLIEHSNPDLAKAYQMKEKLRVILHMKSADDAAALLDEWIQECSESVWPKLRELAVKIARHRQNILNSISLGANSARSESTNTTIKSLIKMARGFWNFNNMASLIYLKCSNVVIPVNNRIRVDGMLRTKRREYMRTYRLAKEQERRKKALAKMSESEPMYHFYSESTKGSVRV